MILFQFFFFLWCQCFISLHLVFSLTFFLLPEILQVYHLHYSYEECILLQKKENNYGNM